MPGATAVPAHLELLTFLSDQNAQVRQVALTNLVGYSAKTSAQRSLLINKHKGLDGKPLQGRNGKDVDTIEDLKKLCQDQPITAHDAFCALINLSDSLVVSQRIADKPFLSFLVRYIADPVSLLTDLACMLLSNLTKLESVCATLVQLQLPARPLYDFMANKDAEASVEAMAVEPDDPEYEQKRQKAKEHSERMARLTQEAQKDVFALHLLLDAFEQGADVAGGESQSAAIEQMRTRAHQLQQQEQQQQDGQQQSNEEERRSYKRKSNCNFLASVFANVTTMPKGREFFVNGSSEAHTTQSSSPPTSDASAREYPITRIMAYTEHPDLIRRGGVVSTLKNLLFLKGSHKQLLAPPDASLSVPGEAALAVAGQLPVATRAKEDTIDVLPCILLPLCDGRELAKLDLEDQEALPDACQLMSEEKRRERDPALRLMLVESLLLLCTTLYGRQCLRGRGAYVVVREAHLDEKDEKVAESVVRLVNILKRDESENSMREVADEVGAEEVQENDGNGGVDEDEETDEEMMVEEL